MAGAQGIPVTGAAAVKAVGDPIGSITGLIIPTILTVLGTIVSLVVTLLLQLDMLLAAILISLAQYNNFVGAQPVVLGWPLVRDVVNMFFIVVLLVIAFSTIIGYQPFHYKDHLPKLLLMAVLINFSKTLIGLLIDFSQVITLTFVNGFQQAAFGNFAKAFQLDKLLSKSLSYADEVAKGNVEVSNVVQTIENTLIAFIFAVIILTITATVLLIMIIYFMARIVGLWLLLIMSPIAFFALALPPKLAKSLSAFTGKWWQQLGAWLSGGPIVAFFLWLTLAVIQGGAGFGDLYKSGSTSEDAQYQAAITDVGSPSNITTFIVAIVLLLSGLNAAVGIAKEASPGLGNIAESIKKSGGPAVIGARLAYRGAAKATVGAARLADKSFQISTKAGAAFMTKGQSMAKSGGAFGKLAGSSVSNLGSRFSAIGAGRRAGIASAFQKETKHLSPSQKLGDLDARIARAKVLPGNAEELGVLQAEKGKFFAHGSSIKAREKELEENYMANAPGVAGQTPEQRKDMASAWAKGMATREAGSAMTDAIKSMEGHGDTEGAEKLKEAMAKNPALYNDMSSLSRVAGNKIDDFKQAFKDVKTEAWGDSGTFLAYMKAAKMDDGKTSLVDERTGKMAEGYKDSAAWRELTERGGNRGKYAEAHAKNLESEGGQLSARTQLAAMNDAATEAQKTAAANARYNVTSSRDDQSMMFANMAPGGGGRVDAVSNRAISEPTMIQNFDELTKGLEAPMRAAVSAALINAGLAGRLDELAKRFNRPLSVEQANHVTSGNNAVLYAPTPPAGGYTPDHIETLARGQALGIPAPPQAQKQVIDIAMSNAASTDVEDRMKGASVMSNINVNEMESSPDIKQAVAEALEGQIGNLEKAFKTSSGDPAMMRKMEDVIKGVSKAGESAKAAAASNGGAFASEIDKKLAQIQDDIRSNKVLNKVLERKNRKA